IDGPRAGQETSHFLKITGKVTGYVPLGREGFSIAMSMSGGGNVQLFNGSETYPDRLFFLGGGDSIRSFLADSVVPQDLADCITKVSSQLECFTLKGRDFRGLAAALNGSAPPREPERIKIDDVSLRGGDIALNPRLE